MDGEGARKTGKVEEYDRGLSHLKYKWTMGRRKEKTGGEGYTFADFVVAANYLHKQISTGANSTRWECFAVPTMQSSLVRPPLSPCCALAPRHIMISGLLR